jgi:nitrous oxide reductase
LGNQRHKINAPSAATLLGLARAAEQGTTTAAAAAAKQGTTTARPRPGDVIGRLDELSHRFLSEIKEFVEVRHPEHARVVDQTI